MIETLKQKIIYWLATRLMPVVQPQDLIQFVESKDLIRTYINGSELTVQEISELKRECRLLDELRIWKIINDYFTNLAQNKMWKQAESKTDILFAKTVLYVLSVQKDIKNKIEKSC
jgi:hypothetical protein